LTVNALANLTKQFIDTDAVKSNGALKNTPIGVFFWEIKNPIFKTYDFSFK
jgi:hypothetical protein